MRDLRSRRRTMAMCFSLSSNIHVGMSLLPARLLQTQISPGPEHKQSMDNRRRFQCGVHSVFNPQALPKPSAAAATQCMILRTVSVSVNWKLKLIYLKNFK